MPNETPTPTRGVPVQLDKLRHLRFSLRTMREVREEFGKDALASGLEGDSVAKMLWYGLKHEDPELTPEIIEDIVDLEQLSDVMEAVAQATGQRGSLALLREAAKLAKKVTEKDLGTDEAVASKIKELGAEKPEDERPPAPAPEKSEEEDAGPSETQESTTPS